MTNKVKILFLPKHSQLGASSRYRTFQYLPFLKQQGILFDVSPLFSKEYLLHKYKTGKENKILTIMRILNRIKTILLNASKYDLLVIEKELIPYLPAFLEYYLILRKIPYILDYDDAIWHYYCNDKNSIMKYIRESKIKNIMNHSQAVICGSEYLLNYANQSKSKRTYKIPTVIDLEKYEKSNNNSQFCIGWIGSPGTSKYILNLNNILKKITDEFDVVVNLIGFDKNLENKLSFNNSIINWSEDTEISELMNFDIGIMPLDDNPFERGKCGFKLIQYMGSSIPVIASPVGENSIIVDHKINGFLANTDDEWYYYIKYYIENPKERSKMGNNGFMKVNEKYSLEKHKYCYLNVIRDVIG